tara:strand:- start:34 stop:3129 length:3096 start_codon:yes stop_codon:yes gene_type:complete
MAEATTGLMNVTLPNGSVIKDVPEGTSDEAIKNYVLSIGFAVEADFADAAPKETENQTQETTDLSAFMSDIPGFAEGDQIISDRKALQAKTARPELWDELGLAFAAETSDVEDWTIAATAAVADLAYALDVEDGVDKLYSPRELYGDEYMLMSQGQKAKFLKQKRLEAVQAEYADTIAGQEAYGASESARVAGSLAKEVFTPTSLIPFGGPLKNVLMKGYLVGAQGAIAEQITEDRWSPIDTIERGLISSVAVGATSKVPQAAGAIIETIKPTYQALQNSAKATIGKIKRQPEPGRASMEAANKTVQKVEDEYVRLITQEGLEDASLVHSTALKNLNLKNDNLVAINMQASQKLSMPSPSLAAKIAFENSHPVSKMSKALKPLDEWGGRLTTRIANTDKRAALEVRKMDFNTNINNVKDQQEISAFFNRGSQINQGLVDKATGAIRNIGQTKARRNLFAQMDNNLMNGNWKAAQKIIDESFPELKGTLEPVKQMLARKIQEAKKGGVDLGQIENYFPRVVKDLAGLRKDLGVKETTVIEQAMKRFAKENKLVDDQNRPIIALIDEADEAIIINKVLQGFTLGKNGSSLTKPRVIKQIPLGLQRHYASGPEALLLYSNRLNKQIELNKFFGTRAVNSKTGGKPFEDRTTAGEILRDLQGRVPDAKIQELTDLFNARYIGEQQVMSKWAAGVRDVSHAITLANPMSAIVQLADASAAGFQNGIKEAATALLKIKKGQLTADDLGVLNKLSAEVANNEGFSKALNELFKYSGFSRADRFGKDVIIDSSLLKYQKMAQSDNGKAAIREKWGEFFGADTQKLIDDLSSKTITDDIKFLVYNDLADVQPISLSEMPEKYLRMKNGRLVYQMKSFFLTQLDMIRRGIVDEFKEGSKKKALRNAGMFGIIIGSNAGIQVTKDVLLEASDKPLTLDNYWDKAVDSAMSLVFASKYNQEKYLSRGDFVGYASNMVAPPALGLATDLFKVVNAETEDRPEEAAKLMKRVPVAGSLVYNYTAGGMEYRQEKREKKELDKFLGK